MRQTFINSNEDMAWLADVFKIPGEWGSAVLIGNEDAPECIELFYAKEPKHEAVPDSVLFAGSWPFL